MKRWHAVVIGCLAVALVWTGVAAQQEVLSRPGPGTGLSSVNVVNRPSVAAEQSGEWQVAIRGVTEVRVNNATPVRVQLPQFAGKGKFLVTWPNGQTETINVLDVGEDGWVQVANAARTGPRWMNLRIAREIEEIR